MLRPTSCAPHTVAATSKAPTAWWSAASQIATPVSTVRMPRTIWVPKVEWMAIEARRAPGTLRTRRAKTTSAATATQAHQRWTKWIR